MGPSEEIQTFEKKTLLGKRFFFRCVDVGNNEVLFPSQTYKTKQGRDKTALRLAYSLGCAVVPGKPR